MKKLFVYLIVMMVVSLGLVVSRVGSKAEAEEMNENEDRVVVNQNRVQTQNEGEETGLQVSTQEQEGLDDENEIEDEDEDEEMNIISTRSENAREHMSEVAKKVEELLMERTEKGGIGEEVRLVAQAQKQAQEEIQLELGKVEGRGKFIKAMIGPDYKALKNMQQQILENQERIELLEEYKNQLTNESEITMVQETIQALIDQNTALQESVSLEEQTRSLFGWLIKLFTD